VTVDEIPKYRTAPLEQDISTAKYQSLIGSLMWLTYATHPDLCVVTSLLAQYNNQPSTGHYDAATYILSYIRGT
jgi:hypothetical protein